MKTKNNCYLDRLLHFLAILLFFSSCSCKQHKSHMTDIEWKVGETIPASVIEEIGKDFFFTTDTISDELFENMKKGNSWKTETPDTLRKHLRHLSILHRNKNGLPQMGEMIVNVKIADTVLGIFKQLYEVDYRIEKMFLMDRYNGDDEAAMRDNNTSCFNFRFKSNSATDISKHGYGLAIDINTLYNPYVKAIGIENSILDTFNYEQRQDGITYDFEPATGEAYAFNRAHRDDIPFKIDKESFIYKLFTNKGFEWGGNWNTRKDYQHFEWTTD